MVMWYGYDETMSRLDQETIRLQREKWRLLQGMKDQNQNELNRKRR